MPTTATADAGVPSLPRSTSMTGFMAPECHECYNLRPQMISFTNVTKQYGAQVLFVDASFQVNAGEKVGLVGPNGAGKTTIFRLITGEESPDDGNVERPRKLRIGYFRQDV